MTIPVTPEGRPGVWLVADRERLMRHLIDRRLSDVHCLIPIGPIMSGADWTIGSVLTTIRDAERVAVLTGDSLAENWGHALACVVRDSKGEALRAFDIGPVAETDLETGT